MKYAINTTSEQDELLAKSGKDVQAELDNKIAELVNQGKQARDNETLLAYKEFDPETKALVDAAVENVMAVKSAKLEDNNLAEEILA